MNSFNTLTPLGVQPTQSVPATETTATSPVYISNYIGGIGIFLLLLGMLGVVARAAELRLKLRKAAQIARLEKIWKMSSQRSTRS